MTTIDEVYRKFGEASEAAQLLETELGTLLIQLLAADKGLFEESNPEIAQKLVNDVNKSTLGQLIRRVGYNSETEEQMVAMFSNALKTRNRLAHNFFREHGLGRNSATGRKAMLEDLEVMHSNLLEAYKGALLLSGIDLNALTNA
ncbi:hypothetical protein [Vibrio vulnificus]|uniref:hypothetical protein n=1 Tax=Vibrio vulnificus TaxID=672 RepID=UPI00287AEC48|nr:hypothetical protein [Vibrio vulnificus]MDS1873253.1 hypothetical protein [Vibrio vulnificus]